MGPVVPEHEVAAVRHADGAKVIVIPIFFEDGVDAAVA